MISVAELYELTYRDIASEQRRGYVSAEEITRAINLAQDVLFNFYLLRGEDRPLLPFLRSAELRPKADGLLTLPDQLRYLRMLSVTGQLAGRERHVVYTVVGPSQWRHLRSDTLLGGNYATDTAWATPARDGYRLWPVPPEGINVSVDYLAGPPPAELVLSFDPTSQVAVVDAAASTDLEWNARERPHLVSLLLAGLGISVRSSELIDFAGAQGLQLQQNLTP